MNKKSNLVVRPDSGLQEFTQGHEALAETLGMVLKMGAADLIRTAAEGLGVAEKLKIGSGLALLKARAQCEAGQWSTYLSEVGIPKQRAAELMAVADLIAKSEPAERERLLGQPKTVLIGVARLDDAMREAAFAQGRFSERLSIAEYEESIEQMHKQMADMAVQRDKAEADLKAMEKKQRRAERDAEDQVVPLVVADARAELAALIKKAELAVTSLHPVGMEIVGLVSHGEAVEWVEPTLRLGLSGLLAVRELVDGAIKSFAEGIGDKVERLTSQPDTLSFLDASEIKALAEDYGRLTALHQHEAALREHERAQARPKGKGRPAKAPEAPKA